MTIRIINGLKFRVDEELKYHLLDHPPLEVKIFYAKPRKSWVLSILEPVGKRWQVSTYGGYASLEEAVTSMELYQ